MTAWIVAGGGVGMGQTPSLGVKADPTASGNVANWRLIVCTGAPDGDAEPFKTASKGSIACRLDNTDDASHLYQKVDEAGDDSDWLIIPAA